METGRSSNSRHDVGRWWSGLRQKADAAEGPDQRLPCWGRLGSVARMSFRDRGGWRYKDLPVRPTIRTTPAFTCKARLNDCSRSEHTSAPCLVQRLVRQPEVWCDAAHFETIPVAEPEGTHAGLGQSRCHREDVAVDVGLRSDGRLPEAEGLLDEGLSGRRGFRLVC